MSRILIVGGDMRNACLAKILHSEGFDVCVCGINREIFEDSDICFCSSVKEGAADASLIILPLPCSADNITLATPLFDDCIYLSDIYENALKSAIICGGKINTTEFEKHSLYAVDYAQRDDFASLNAVPTAEGAIEAVMKYLPITVFSSNAVVTGFGKSGKVLALTLKAMGANVTVCARSQKDLALASAFGINALPLDKMHTALENADMVFNTVPHTIFKERELSAIKHECPIVDIASLPGGVDRNALENLGIRYLFLPGLPGKYSPVSAARIIWRTIINIIGESGKDASLWNLREKG
ncbi:MAG: NAD(P)-binding domain-containing protein [Clostridia bacterium]|nr:NAD(P)-binding domain-containing protein [Clostridia bacterium]